MPDDVLIEVEDDPTPLVLIIAATLRRAARTPKLAATIARAKGSVALKSSVDPQACTIRFGSGRTLVSRGVAPDADVVIEADLNNMSDPAAPKPKVTGALRHPKLALAVSKVLEPPTGTWQDEAETFWAFVAMHPGSPRGLRIVCTDTSDDVSFGERPAEYEIFGSASALTTMLSGGSVFGEDLLSGKLCGVGALKHTAELTGRSLAFMMGAAGAPRP